MGQDFIENENIETLLDKDLNFVRLEKGFSDLLGFKEEELLGLGLEKLIKDNKLDRLKEYLKREAPFTYTNTLKFRLKSGEEVPLDIQIYRKGDFYYLKTKKALWNKDLNDKKDISLNAFLFDEYEKSLMLNAIEDFILSIVITDKEGDILYVNPTFEKVTGYSYKDAIGKNPRVLKTGLTDERVYEELWYNITHEKTWEGEFINKRRDGSFYYEEARITPVLDISGDIKYFLAFKIDISERKNLEARLKERAVKDSLTSIYNRRYFMDKLRTFLEEYKVEEKVFTLAMLDIDHFKKVNDNYGHQMGDYVLKELGKIINDSIRDRDVFARYGGEEFAIIFAGIGKDIGEAVLSRILDKIRRHKFQHDNKTLSITLSAGLVDSSEFERKKLTREILLSVADKRLYKAKEAGRDRIISED